MPEEVRRQFEARSGYTNYYFNKLERERVWKAFTARGSFARTAAKWKIKGTLADESLALFEFSDQEAMADLPAALSRVKFTNDLALNRDPEGSGGLLVALHLWQRLLRLGPEKFGQVSYWGTAPVVGQKELCDVLVGVQGGVEARFYFAAGGELVTMELFTDDGTDPCEIWFGEYQEHDGLRLPRRLEVRRGDGVFAAVKVQEWRVAAEKAP